MHHYNTPHGTQNKFLFQEGSGLPFVCTKIVIISQNAKLFLVFCYEHIHAFIRNLCIKTARRKHTNQKMRRSNAITCGKTENNLIVLVDTQTV